MHQSLRGNTVTNHFKFSLAGTSTIALYSFESPWASLCPCANTFCVRGVASARPRRASKRNDCRLWKRDLSHQQFSWSRQAGTRDQFLETELGPPLFEDLIANAVFLCDADRLLHWRLKTGPPRRHQIQPVEGPVLDPRAKETYLKRVRKWTPLKSKVAPSLSQICWSVYFKLKLIWPATAATGILNWGGPFLRACFLLRCEDQKKGPLFVILARFVTRKAPCYLTVTSERCRTNSKGFLWGHWLVPSFFCGPSPLPFGGSTVDLLVYHVTIAAPYPAGIDPRLAVYARSWDGHYTTTRRDRLHWLVPSSRGHWVTFKIVL